MDRKRAIRLLATTFFVYALLTATHLGEFWPFSIYPMFSQGGKPWSRAVVRDVSREAAFDWQPYAAEQLPGRPYALLPWDVDPIDLANFVSKTSAWDTERVAGLRRMFYDQLEGRALLVMRAQGHIDARDSVIVQFIPYVLLEQDTTVLNPQLPR